MNRKGVCYDAGRVMMGSNWRIKFEPGEVHRELQIIKEDLHCNAVRICGLDIDRLTAAGEDALAQGLEVWFSPEMWDRGQDETLQYIAKAAASAEKLRQRWPGRVVFSVGSELTLFMRGFVEGDNVFDRMSNPSFWQNVTAGTHNAPLNAFLAKANEAARRVFRGQVVYFSVPFEQVDWGPFDFVGVDHYRDARIRDVYGKMVGSYLAHDKPVIVGEFGCCTYRGAEKLGGSGFAVMFGMLADYLGPGVKLPRPFSDLIKIPTKVDGHYVRDEALQAREVVEQLSALEEAGVEGAFVFTFVAPTSPYSDDPRFDSDMASYSLVKSFAEKETVEEMTRQSVRQGKEILGVDVDPRAVAEFSGEVGRHGETYPDMPWEPKESFRAVADSYGTH